MSSGPLEPLKLFKVFRSMLERRTTGVLTVTAGQVVKKARIVQGQATQVASNRPEESLARALVEEGLISSTERIELERERQNLRQSLEALVIERGLVAAPRLYAIENRLARARLLEIFGWGEGTFTFENTPVRPDPARPPIDTIELLLDAAAQSLAPAVADRFLSGFRGQRLHPSDWAARYASFHDTLFPPPNLRGMLTQPMAVEDVARMPGDRTRNLREATALILAGLANLQWGPEAARPVEAARPAAPPPAPSRTPPTMADAARPVRPPPAAPSPPPARPLARDPQQPRGRPVRLQASAPPGAASPASVRALPADLPAKIRETLDQAELLVSSMAGKSHYEVLGIATNADEQAIRTAFKRFAREYHADRFSRYGLDKEALAAVQKVFIAINRAHEVLTDTAARTEYDLTLEMKAKGHSMATAAEGGGPAIDRVFRAEKMIKDGATLLSRGDSEAAIERFKQALAVVPDDPVGQAGLAFAECLLAQTRGGGQVILQRTKEKLEALTANVDNREEPFLYLGRIYRALGENDKAIAVLEQAVRINPHFAEAGSELRHAKRKVEQTRTGKIAGLFGRRKK
ncbi:MAG: DnaJ domain-containing protein [Myxococcales bacterium]|nr:DnaJ domain-containing protein [Myxococcales bacterium]